MNRKYRIRKSEEFSKIIKQKHCFSSVSFYVYATDRKLDDARVGISVSKKLGNAVIRNRIKRQVKEMIRSLIDFESYPKDLIIIVKRKYLDNDFTSNKNDLEKALKKAII